jgi:hypothetical protein
MKRLALAFLMLPLAHAGSAAAAGLDVRGSVEQVQVTGARAGAHVRLLDRRGRAVADERAGSLGGVGSAT